MVTALLMIGWLGVVSFRRDRQASVDWLRLTSGQSDGVKRPPYITIVRLIQGSVDGLCPSSKANIGNDGGKRFQQNSIRYRCLGCSS